MEYTKEQLWRMKHYAFDLYEALRAVSRDLEDGKGVIFPYTEKIVKQAIAKVEEGRDETK